MGKLNRDVGTLAATILRPYHVADIKLRDHDPFEPTNGATTARLEQMLAHLKKHWYLPLVKIGENSAKSHIAHSGVLARHHASAGGPGVRSASTRRHDLLKIFVQFIG